jgi:hypothetical protein
MPRRNDIQLGRRSMISTIGLLALLSNFPSVALAQVDCVMPRKLVVSRVQGQVFDLMGRPIPGAQISLKDDGAAACQIKTDDEGKFRFDKVSGLHGFKVEAPGFDSAAIDLDVGGDVQSLLRPSYLRVILGIGGSSCPIVTVSKKEFEQEIRANNKRFQEAAKNNATQK